MHMSRCRGAVHRKTAQCHQDFQLTDKPALLLLATTWGGQWSAGAALSGWEAHVSATALEGVEVLNGGEEAGGLGVDGLLLATAPTQRADGVPERVGRHVAAICSLVGTDAIDDGTDGLAADRETERGSSRLDGWKEGVCFCRRGS